METNETVTSMQLKLPADLEQIRLVGTCISLMLTDVCSIAEAEVTLYNVQLAVQEICVNIVTHAYEGIFNGQIQVVLTLTKQPSTLIIELYDTGQPFELEAVPLPNLDEIGEHGYGLFLARELLDEVHYETRQSGNYWRLRKHL